jgi:error-prone DNA polymerase
MHMVYAELHCLSNFSFQRGASSARELFERAQHCGYSALAITDEASLAGIVRAHEASLKTGVKLIVGSEFCVESGSAEAFKLVILVANPAGYRALCGLITDARRSASKGSYALSKALLAQWATPDWRVLWAPDLRQDGVTRNKQARFLRALFSQNLWLAVHLHQSGDDAARLAQLQAMAAEHALALVAAGDVHMHVRARRALQDVMTAIAQNVTLSEAGYSLFPNGERHLRSIAQLAQLYPPALLAQTQIIADSCHFAMTSLGYEYPHELVPAGISASMHLRALTELGASQRWPEGLAYDVHSLLERELALIAELKYEHFFLTVHDIVRFARSQGILCQGRGSAANSAVCFCLGITEVDPARQHVLFERFLSRERNEAPDIDVDFEHERREEVLQYVYQKYGRDRAALAATVISYQTKSAVRDVARSLGLSMDQIQLINSNLSWWDDQSVLGTRLREQGFDPDTPLFARLRSLVQQLIDQPRHLSQHVGGFVISEHPLHSLVPVENASMPGRTIIQWDKDDLETLGLLKVDCLALGMLSCLRRCLQLVESNYGLRYSLASIPAEDPHTYAMLSRADTVGVFQVESRAQMSMLPRLRPKNFFDLVVQVAIVRPGPIQGGMVHPYLRRRSGAEPVEYPSEAVRKIFERTLGVPIFQEQVMELVVVAAGFTPGEADQLRRSMAAWKRHGGLEHYQSKILDGMRERGYPESFALQIFEQIKGFGSYGFPESHAASFALLVYASAWLKCHYPAAFTCALLNAYPMGFYSPDQLLQDARRSGTRIIAPDVMQSMVDSSLFEGAILLGLREIKGLSQAAQIRIVQARSEQAFHKVQDFSQRCALHRGDLAALADSGALAKLAGDRFAARWQVDAIEPEAPLLQKLHTEEAPCALPVPSAVHNMQQDYQRLGYSLGAHPFQLLRAQLQKARIKSVSELLQARHGSSQRCAGIVTLRQRPSTANGTMFLTLEDETGWLNVVLWPREVERFRSQLLSAPALEITGRFEHVEGVKHLITQYLCPLRPALLASIESTVFKIQPRQFH